MDLKPSLARGLVCILPQFHHRTNLFQRQHREFSLQLIAPFVDLQNPESRVITKHKRLNTLIKSQKFFFVCQTGLSTVRNQAQMLQPSLIHLQAWWGFMELRNLSDGSRQHVSLWAQIYPVLMHACMHANMPWDGMSQKVMLEIL